MAKVGKGSAHAKIILIGEHSVVYNHPAISIGVPVLTTEVTVESAQEDWLDSSLYKGCLNDCPDALKGLQSLVIKLRDTLNLPPLKIMIASQIPVSSGMGSSAAVTSALIEACYDFKASALDIKTRFDLTQFSEKFTHGNPSGIDSLTVFSNDALYYVKGKPVVPIKINLEGFLVVAYSGVKSDTFKAVDWVSKNIHKVHYQNAIAALGDLTIAAKDCIEKNIIDDLGSLFNDAQKQLNILQLSHPLIDAMIQEALHLGAVGAKLSGGGLGGIMIALVKDKARADTIVEAFKLQYTESVWVFNLKG